ncbi:MAG TPA: PAS domain-containing protein [Terriglobales bacterium]|nr:PAS domain-containing protein [Terriglobales bacterium]
MKIKGKELREKWAPAVDCIADLLGPRAEVVLHDVSRPDHSIIMIRNGQVTGRSVGAPLTDLGFYMLRECGRRINTLGVYRSTTPDGKTLKCNAANLRDAHGRIEAILCINIDVSGDAAETPGSSSFAEHYQTNIQQVIDGIIRDTCRDGEHLLNGDKAGVVRALDARGVFLARGAVKRISEVLGIATPTIYKYLQQGRKTQKPTAQSDGDPRKTRPRALKTHA